MAHQDARPAETVAPHGVGGGAEAQRRVPPDQPGRSAITVIIALAAPRQVVLDAIRDFADTELHVLATPEQLPDLDPAGHGAYPWAASSVGQVNWCLRMIGSPEVILDLSPGTADAHRVTWNRAFLHLVADGVYRVGRSAFPDDLEYKSWAFFLLGVFAASQGLRFANPELSARETRLVGFTGGVSVSADVTEIRRQRDSVLKVRDEEASRVIATRLRGHQVRELVRISGGNFTVRGRTVNHGNHAPIAGIETAFDLPTKRIRVYEGPRVRVVERCLAVVGDVVIPESFRFPYEKNLRNPRLVDIDGEFAMISNDWNYGWDYLPGSYYHLDASNSGHFGHLMTEVISKLWGWDQALAEFPDLKAIFRIRQPQERDPRLEREIFGAYGIPADRIVWTGSPVRVDRLVAATPLWHNQFPHYADPMMKEVWDRMSQRLVVKDDRTPEKLFISRADGLENRSCRNTPEVEAFFEKQGFEIVYPELLPLSRQATLFAGARVIAGFGGSALFNAGFCRRLEKLIVLNHEAYTARNEHLYGALLGCDVHYFWSAPDIPHPEGGWSEAAYFSSWECDVHRLKRDLLAVMR